MHVMMSLNFYIRYIYSNHHVFIGQMVAIGKREYHVLSIRRSQECIKFDCYAK